MDKKLVLDKEYIERYYYLAYLDYRLALSENDRWKARKEMAKLELIAMEEHGFEYADMLHQEVLFYES